MKKNILKATLVAAFALFAGYNVYTSQKSDVMSDLTLANVEALAHNEAVGTHNHGPTRNPFLGSKYCKNENNIDCAY